MHKVSEEDTLPVLQLSRLQRKEGDESPLCRPCRVAKGTVLIFVFRLRFSRRRRLSFRRRRRLKSGSDDILNQLSSNHRKLLQPLPTPNTSKLLLHLSPLQDVDSDPSPSQARAPHSFRQHSRPLRTSSYHRRSVQERRRWNASRTSAQLAGRHFARRTRAACEQPARYRT